MHDCSSRADGGYLDAEVDINQASVPTHLWEYDRSSDGSITVAGTNTSSTSLNPERLMPDLLQMALHPGRQD